MYYSLPGEVETRVYVAEDATIVLSSPWQRARTRGLPEPVVSLAAKLLPKLSGLIRYQGVLGRILQRAALFVYSICAATVWGLFRGREILWRAKSALVNRCSVSNLGAAALWAGLIMVLLGLGMGMDPIVLLGGLLAACGFGVWLAIAILRILVSRSLH